MDHLLQARGACFVAAAVSGELFYFTFGLTPSWLAALRGVESGYSVVRVGREGSLNASDRYGHTIARKRSDYMPGSSVLVDLPLGPATPTLYVRCGNAFGWLSVVGSAITVVLAGHVGNQPEPARANA